MQTLRLDASQLGALTSALMRWGPVWAPIETEPGVFTLQVVGDETVARPDVLRTVIPFIKLLLPTSITDVELLSPQHDHVELRFDCGSARATHS